MGTSHGTKRALPSTQLWSWRLASAVQMWTWHSSTSFGGQTADRQKNTWGEKLLHALRCYTSLYMLMPIWDAVWNKRNKEDENQHPEMPQRGTTVPNNSFSAPSCSLLCQCRIKLWNYSHETYFFLFFTYTPSLLLLGISNNLYKYLQFCLENHGQIRLVACRSWKRSHSTHCVQGSGCKVWAERRGHVEPVTWLW